MERDSFGFLNLKDIKDIHYTRGYSHFSFTYEGKKYFFKRTFGLDTLYNELIAEEIAKEFGIPCIHYDLADYNGNIGVICEDFIKDGKYEVLSDLLYDDSYNNLEQIQHMLQRKYQNDYLVKELMQEVINIYMFDIVIGNSDRHADNLGILENEQGIHFGPVFDNDLMLFDNAVYGDNYSLGVTHNDFEYNGHIVNRFIEVYGEEYRDILLNKMEIVSPENMERIIKRVENRIGTEMNDYIKGKVLKGMAFYYEKMKSVLLKEKSYKRV